MNFIICAENCAHQKEGYCSLSEDAQITNAISSPCCYYCEKKSKKKEKKKSND